MKLKIVLFFIIVFVNAKASVYTVNNTIAGAAQFMQINPAIAAANAGDTIYVSGSASTYTT